MPDISSDRFNRWADAAGSPARDAFAITPHDSNALTAVPKALLIGAGGALRFRAIDAIADVSVTVVTGQLLPVRVAYVRATGTTAGQIVGLA